MFGHVQIIGVTILIYVGIKVNIMNPLEYYWDHENDHKFQSLGRSLEPI